MRPNVDQNAWGELVKAIRSNDLVSQMRIITENVEKSGGEERAFWLRLRANSLGRVTGKYGFTDHVKADFDEAMRLSPDDIASQVSQYLVPVFTLQQLAPLSEIPYHLRRTYWREVRRQYSLAWTIAQLHWLRRRWYQSLRATTRTIEILSAMPPEERQYYDGWFYVFHAERARAALRLGRRADAVADVQVAEKVAETRENLHPYHIAMARAELSLDRGDCQAALGEIHACLARLAKLPGTWMINRYQVELDLLAARIARAEGNQLGFDHFCAKALAVCLKDILPMSEAHVRAVMSGAPF